MKRTFSRHFGFTFKVKVRLVLLVICFESRHSIKMKRTFNRHFGFVFSKDFFLVVLCESCNSMKMKSSFNCHFGFAFTLFFWKSQFNENEKDFQPSFWLCFLGKSSFQWFFFEYCNSMKMKSSFNYHSSFVFTLLFLKVAIQWKWKGLSIVILALVFNKSRTPPNSWFFLKAAIHSTWKALSSVILAAFQRKSKLVLSNLFWKSQFNEMKRTFNNHLGFAFTDLSEVFVRRIGGRLALAFIFVSLVLQWNPDCAFYWSFWKL